MVIGRITGIYGVKGWVRVHSYTDPLDSILNYSCWQLGLPSGWAVRRLVSGRRQGKGLVAHIEGVDDREQARALIGSDIAIERSALPAVGDNEFYWVDLIGMQVVTLDGVSLGQVDYLIETGANDVLVVRGERERCLPYVRGDVIKRIDREAGIIEVDWDPEF